MVKANHNVKNNREQRSVRPAYYVDTSIIIIMQKIEALMKRGASKSEIVEMLMKGGRMNEKAAVNLIEKYNLLKQDKIVFCITPTVYKEAMLDANVKETQGMVKKYIKLVLPNINSAKFAELVRTIALELEEAKSKNGHKGINPNFKNKNGVLVDDNLEDRLILAEIIAYSILGKRNIRFIDCSERRAKSRQTLETLSEIGKRYNQSQVGHGRDIQDDYSADNVVEIFIHSNPNDFGNSLKVGNDTASKDLRQVSIKVKEIVEKILKGKSKLVVVSPDELEKGGY